MLSVEGLRGSVQPTFETQNIVEWKNQDDGEWERMNAALNLMLICGLWLQNSLEQILNLIMSSMKEVLCTQECRRHAEGKPQKPALFQLSL